jgi:protein-tyrosine phosphatase
MDIRPIKTEAVIPPPILHSYWVLPGRFLAGMHPGATDRQEAQEMLQALVRAGITVFINLAEDHGRLSYEEVLQRECAGGPFDCWRSPIPDMGTPSREQMAQILDRIDAALVAKRAVYVHCLAGIGRTGTVVGCYLARHGLAGEEALREIARLRRGSPTAYIEAPETEAQRQFVRAWQPGM